MHKESQDSHWKIAYNVSKINEEYPDNHCKLIDDLIKTQDTQCKVADDTLKTDNKT